MTLIDRKENDHRVLVVHRRQLRRGDDCERESFAVVQILDGPAVGLQGPIADALLESPADATPFDPDRFGERLLRKMVGAGKLHRRNLELATGGDREAQNLLVALGMELCTDFG